MFIDVAEKFGTFDGADRIWRNWVNDGALGFTCEADDIDTMNGFS